MAAQARRTRRATSLRAVRGVMATLDRVSPAAAGTVAERLWFRVPVTPTAGLRHRHTPEDGRPFRLKVNDIALAGAEYGPADGPLALLVHGWGGWWQQLSATVAPLAGQGYRVVAYDAPSHGDSAPGVHGRSNSSFIEVASTYAGVVRRLGTPRLVVAHSMGAMATLWARREYGTPASDAVFVAPAVSVEPMVAAYAQLVGLSPRAAGVMVERLCARTGRGLDEFEVLPVVPGWATEGSLPRLVVVHDRGDHEAPFSYAERLVEAWPGARLVATDGLGHRRVLWDPRTLAEVRELAG